MMKDLNYYMSLPYKIEVEELSERDGGGKFLSIPLLGRMAVCAHGYTYDEAREHLELVKKDILEILLEDGCDIPEPPKEEDWLKDLEKLLDEMKLEEPIPIPA